MFFWNKKKEKTFICSECNHIVSGEPSKKVALKYEWSNGEPHSKIILDFCNICKPEYDLIKVWWACPNETSHYYKTVEEEIFPQKKPDLTDKWKVPNRY